VGPPQRSDAAGARSKAIFRKNFACSSPTPNTTQAASHFSVTAGHTALGTIIEKAGGFVATGTRRRGRSGRRPPGSKKVRGMGQRSIVEKAERESLRTVLDSWKGVS
jgi:hypothetical protein